MPSRKRIGESVPHPARGLGPRLQFPVRAGSVRRWTDLASQVSSLRSARYDRTAPIPHSCRDSQSVTRILPRGAETIASPGRCEVPDTREIDFEAFSHSETRTNRENAWISRKTGRFAEGASSVPPAKTFQAGLAFSVGWESECLHDR